MCPRKELTVLDDDCLNKPRQNVHNKYKLTEPLFNETSAQLISPNSKDIRSIVYVYKSLGNPIKRLRGESVVLYIGYATGSLYERYNISKELRDYRDVLQYIIDDCGGFTVEIFEANEPQKLESLLLWRYKKIHHELPPLNLSSYKARYIRQYKADE